PLYNWALMKKENYAWWKKRLGYALKLYDTVRIDHFSNSSNNSRWTKRLLNKYWRR
ncbi:MAG: 4-alpha-glucanotransferase, partial [Paludibacteraceae bacterium]|nr:4-alpha-glucanotransferase [Paludibacteraceae bacterium]